LNPSSLPITSLRGDLARVLRGQDRVIVQAPPGSGKSTQIPQFLLDDGLAGTGRIVVLQPRRLAARLLAKRVAEERGVKLGGEVGFHYRLENVSSRDTRILYVTEGILLRQMQESATLPGIAVLIFDEFHERHLEGDLALARARQIQQTTRPDLKIIVMSATLETALLTDYLKPVEVLESPGKIFPVTLEYLPKPSDAPAWELAADACERLLNSGKCPEGDILVFMPGAYEIQRTLNALRDSLSSRDFAFHALHGELPPAEQDAAVSPSQKRKLIVSTNVAETSLTIDGVRVVIDSGLARIATHSQWSGLPTLRIGRVSKASAKQRAGRAGRTAPGRVLRLYSEQDYLRRPDEDAPEILGGDLSQLCLALRAMGVRDVSDGDWLDAPPAAAVQRAESLLDRLGVTGSAVIGSATGGVSGDMAQRLARYPLPPRLSRILVEALERGVGEDGCVAVALVASGVQVEQNDLLAAMESDHDFRTRQLIEQLRRIARPARQAHHDDDALLMSVLAGFPDRIARLRAGNQVLLSTGTSAEVAAEPPRYEFMVAIDAEDRTDKPLPLVRMISRIEPEWLIDLFPDRVREQS